MIFRFRIHLTHGDMRVRAICQHTSGGEALAELCDFLGIIFPSHASIVRIE